MNRALRFGLAVLLLDSAPVVGQAPAEPPSHHSDASFDVRVGTTGFGVELRKLLTGHVGARVGGSFYSFSTSKSQSDISYDASLKLHTFQALIDLFPGRRGSFHVTGGIVTNPLTITATGVPAASDSFRINGTEYHASDVGTLTAEGKFRGASPYLGFGFGTPANEHRALKLLFDLGAVVSKPTITLSASGSGCAPGTACGNDLQAQQTQTQHDVRKYLKVFPVLSFGLGYRF